MEIIGKRKVKKIEQKVIDFLDYFESSTSISYDWLDIEGYEAIVETPTGHSRIPTICMPAEFYTVFLDNYPVAFEIRFCTCEFCQMITYICIISKNENEKIVDFIKELLENLVPDIKLYVRLLE